MHLNVYLASGKSCSVALPHEASIREMKAEAQQQLEHRFLRLLFGSEELDPSLTLADTVTAVAQHVKLASTWHALHFMLKEAVR